MPIDDAAAAEFYDNAKNREPAGPARMRSRNPSRWLAKHVPVRFAAETINSVKRLAADDGVSVSTWIHNCVIREVERRQQHSWTGVKSLAIFEFEEVGKTPTTTTLASENQAYLRPA